MKRMNSLQESLRTFVISAVNKLLTAERKTGSTAGDAVERSMCASAPLRAIAISDSAPITLS
jgi:hypothetical protein